MSSAFDEMKSIIIAGLHAERKHRFIIEFQKNNHRDPTQDEVSAFIAHLIAVGNINKEADDLTKDFINKATKQSRIKNILINSTYTIPLCTILIVFILILVNGSIPENMKDGTAWFYATLIPSIILFCITIVFTVISAVNTKK